MDFYTKYNRPDEKFAELGGKNIVEIGTYVRADKLIKSFVNAGKIIGSSRQISYDFPDGVDDGRNPDPTRRPDFDLADFSQIVNTIRDNKEKLEVKGAKNEVVNATDSSSTSTTESVVDTGDKTSNSNPTN